MSLRIKNNAMGHGTLQTSRPPSWVNLNLNVAGEAMPYFNEVKNGKNKIPLMEEF